jgi:hypothetical protein
MRPLSRTRPGRLAVLAGIGLALTIGLAACGSADVTRPRVEGSLSEVFTNLYIQQQDMLGKTGVTATSMAATPTCHRGGGGPAVPDVGAGSDWVCMVTWNDGDGAAQVGKFELQVRSNGCYMAGGPSKIVGPLKIRLPNGTTVINPVFEFDGCFNTF